MKFISGLWVSREIIGLPLDWNRVDNWTSNRGDIPDWPYEKPARKSVKNPEVKSLQNYDVPAPEGFWDSFPKNLDISGSKTNLNTDVFTDCIKNASEGLTAAEIKRGEKSVKFLKEGGPAYQKVELPGCMIDNAPSAAQFGELVTDNIATWIKKDFVCSHFDCPPLDNFRVNSLMAIDQNDKVRLVLNVSLPHGKSFNSNIDEEKMEKVKMSSARQFGYSVAKAGKNAKMSKFDLTDAYKNIPCKEGDLRLQGFCWLGKFFIEKRMIFGARTSVGNFDVFGNSLKSLALASCEIPSSLVHRQLDDVPSVAPVNSSWDKEFTESYMISAEKLVWAWQRTARRWKRPSSIKQEGKFWGLFLIQRSCLGQCLMTRSIEHLLE